MGPYHSTFFFSLDKHTGIGASGQDHTVVAILLTYMEHKKEILQILLKESDYCFWEKIHIGLTHLFKAKVLQQYRISDNVNMKELDDAIVFLTNGFYGIYRQWILSECKESANYIARYSARLSSACLKELLG